MTMNINQECGGKLTIRMTFISKLIDLAYVCKIVIFAGIDLQMSIIGLLMGKNQNFCDSPESLNSLFFFFQIKTSTLEASSLDAQKHLNDKHWYKPV